MYRMLITRPDWTRVTERRFDLSYIENNKFKGYVAVTYIDEVTEPFYVKTSQGDVCLADKGYIWMQHLPVGKNYSCIAMLDNNEEVIQWYFDITNENGINKEGIPYFDDLYLDVVVVPSNEVKLLDEDELEEALHNKVITKKQYNLAYKTAKELMEEIEQGQNYLINDHKVYLHYMKSLR